MKIVFLILAGGGAEHISDEKTQRITWAHNSSSLFSSIWLRAGGEFIYDDDSRVLKVPCEENELLHKTVFGLKWLCKSVDFDIVVRTNVSTFFAVDRLRDRLVNLKFDKDCFGGHLNYISDGTKADSKFFISGTGIFLGGAAVEWLQRINLDKYELVPDDVAITRHLLGNQNLKLKSVRCLRLSNHHMFFPASPYVRCKSSWNSNLASRRMTLLSEYWDTQRNTNKVLTFWRVIVFEVRSCRYSIKTAWRFPHRLLMEVREYFLNSKFR